jgi:hypothetical protein
VPLRHRRQDHTGELVKFKEKIIGEIGKMCCGMIERDKVDEEENSSQQES